MKQSEFEQKLKRTRLSSPGVSFDEIAARVRPGDVRRPGRNLLRLAIAAAAVWLIVCLAHIAVDRSIEALTPGANQSLIADDGGNSTARMVGGGLAARHKLMQDLVAESTRAGQAPLVPREHGKPDGRSSQAPGRERSVCHV